MALRMWASSTAKALKISCASKAYLSPAFSLSRCFSTVLDGLKYASSHEWVKHEGSVATVGITDHAQDHLGEVVFVELPEKGGSVSQGQGFGAVESVKATSDVNSPISGEVVEVNSKLSESPGLINSSPYEDGWMIKVKPSNPAELESLLGPKEYTKFCEGRRCCALDLKFAGAIILDLYFCRKKKETEKETKKVILDAN